MAIKPTRINVQLGHMGKGYLDPKVGVKTLADLAEVEKFYAGYLEAGQVTWVMDEAAWYAWDGSVFIKLDFKGDKGDKGDQGDSGEGFHIDAECPDTNCLMNLYCDKLPGFTVLVRSGVADVNEGKLYFKKSNPTTSPCGMDNWTEGYTFNTGIDGDDGRTVYLSFAYASPADIDAGTPDDTEVPVVTDSGEPQLPYTKNGVTWTDGPDASQAASGKRLYLLKTKPYRKGEFTTVPWNVPATYIDGDEGRSAGVWTIWNDKIDGKPTPPPFDATKMDTEADLRAMLKADPGGWYDDADDKNMDGTTDDPGKPVWWATSILKPDTQTWANWTMTKVAGEKPSYIINVFRWAPLNTPPAKPGHTTIEYGKLASDLYPDPTADDWRDAPGIAPTGDDTITLWQSVANVQYTGAPVETIEWSTPMNIEGTEGPKGDGSANWVIWSKAASPSTPKKLTGPYDAYLDDAALMTYINDPAWIADAGSATVIYSATAFYIPKAGWTDWKIAKVKGEDGTDGTDGRDGVDGKDGTSFRIDAQCTSTDCLTNQYCDEGMGFAVLVTNSTAGVNGGTLYFKKTAGGSPCTLADWSDGIDFNTGMDGQDGKSTYLAFAYANPSEIVAGTPGDSEVPILSNGEPQLPYTKGAVIWTDGPNASHAGAGKRLYMLKTTPYAPKDVTHVPWNRPATYIDGDEGRDAGVWQIWNDKLDGEPTAPPFDITKMDTEAELRAMLKADPGGWYDDVDDKNMDGTTGDNGKPVWWATTFLKPDTQVWAPWVVNRVAGEKPTYLINVFRWAPPGTPPAKPSTTTIVYGNSAADIYGDATADDWRDAPGLAPSGGGNILWQAVSNVRYTGATLETLVWSEPIVIEGIPGAQGPQGGEGPKGDGTAVWVIWSKEDSPSDPKQLEGLYDAYKTDAKLMEFINNPDWIADAGNDIVVFSATAFFIPGEGWTTWKIAKVKGEDGTDGADGADGADGRDGADGTSFRIDAQCPNTDCLTATYCGEDKGFAVLVTTSTAGVQGGRLYFKKTDAGTSCTLADWTDGIDFNTGVDGQDGKTVYLSFAYATPSTIAAGTPTDTEVPVLPTGEPDLPHTKNGVTWTDGPDPYYAGNGKRLYILKTTAYAPDEYAHVPWHRPATYIDGDEGAHGADGSDGSDGKDAGVWQIWNDLATGAPADPPFDTTKMDTEAKLRAMLKADSGGWYDDVDDKNMDGTVGDYGKPIWWATSYLKPDTQVWTKWVVNRVTGEKPTYLLNVFRWWAPGTPPSKPSKTTIEYGKYASDLYNNTADDWRDAPGISPGGNKILWQSVANVNFTGAAHETLVWSKPITIEATEGPRGDGSAVWVIWSKKAAPTKPKKLVGKYDAYKSDAELMHFLNTPNPSDWIADAGSASVIFSATAFYVPGPGWTDWKIAKVKGEKGDNGSQGLKGDTARTYIPSSMFVRCDDPTIESASLVGMYLTEKSTGYFEIEGTAPSVTIGGIKYQFEDGIPVFDPAAGEHSSSSKKRVYMIQGVFNSVDHLGPTKKMRWSLPTPLVDSASLDYMYHPGVGAAHGKPAAPGPGVSGWVNTPQEDSYWLAQRDFSKGPAYAQWQVYKIRGEDGKDAVYEGVPPSKVTGLSDATASNWKTCTLSWQAATDQDGDLASYEIKNGYTNNSIVAIDGLSTHHTLTWTTGNTVATNYYFRVRAIDKKGHVGEWSEALSKHGAPVIPKPPIPKILTNAESGAGNTVSLSFSATDQGTYRPDKYKFDMRMTPHDTIKTTTNNFATLSGSYINDVGHLLPSGGSARVCYVKDGLDGPWSNLGHADFDMPSNGGLDSRLPGGGGSSTPGNNQLTNLGDPEIGPR